MRILILKHTQDYTNPTISQSVGTVATLLHNEGHEVKAIDNNAFYKYYTNAKLIKEAKKFNPDIIAFNITINNAFETYRLLPLLKKSFPDLLFVAGGIHVKYKYKEVLEKGFDVAVPQDGELVAGPLFKHLQGKTRQNFKKDLNKIEGVCFIKENGDFHIADTYPMIENLDDVPFINYKLFNLKDYIKTGREPGLLLINGERGCPFACTFCSDEFMLKDRRLTSAEYMFQNVKEIYEEYGLTYISIVDTNFLLYKERVIEFCNKMIDSGLNKVIRFTCQFRVDAKFDEDLVKLLKKAGFFKFYFGIERLVPESLKLINKNVSFDRVMEAFELLKASDIQIHFNMILGFPFETVDLIRQERAMFKKILPYTQTIFINILMPTPGTRYYDDYPKTWNWYLNPKFNKIMKTYYGHVLDLNMMDMLEFNFFDLPDEVINEIRECYVEFKEFNHGQHIEKKNLVASLALKFDIGLAKFSRVIYNIWPSFEFWLFRKVKSLRYYFGVLLMRKQEV